MGYYKHRDNLIFLILFIRVK